MNIETIELDVRHEGTGPVFTGSYQIGDYIENWEIAPSNQVTLKHNNVTVLANVTEVEAGNYKAEIIGFESFAEEELSGKKAGDMISFTYENIFGCSR